MKCPQLAITSTWHFNIRNFISISLYLWESSDCFGSWSFSLISPVCTLFNIEFHNLSLAFWHSLIEQYLKSEHMRGAQWGKKNQQDSGELKLDHQFSSGERGTSHWPLPLPSTAHCYSCTTRLETFAVNWPWTFQFLTCGEKVLLICKLSYIINEVHQ